MRAKRIKCFLLVILLGALLLFFSYLGISRLYSHRFAYGTWINGIYCTGKTVTEVNELLAEQTVTEDLEIVDKYGQTTVILSETIGMKVDYSGQLRNVLESQNPYLWVGSLQQNFQHISLKPEYIFQESLLVSEIEKTDMVVSACSCIQDVGIKKGNAGYEFYDGTKGVLDVEKVIKTAREAIYRGEFAINLAETECYKDLEWTAEMQEKAKLFQQIDEFQNIGITYDMGDGMVEVGPGIVAEWITLDENGEIALDENGKLILEKEGINRFIEQLAAEYDTYGSVRTFHSTRGDVVEIKGGTYGNKINKESEILYLTDAFLNKISEIHIPVYEKEAYVRGKNDIGDTYIEIDMTCQKMYYYEKGELKLETDVVTGSVEEGHKTPEGVNFVYYKSRNTTLRGKDYESFVKYWMAVKGGIGIHDASWRRKFGGEIYLKNGSHGCINTPGDVMKELYNTVEKGTPVVMFY